MLVCTKRKDLQEQKHLMQLCSNDSFSSPFFPSLFWTNSFIHWLLRFPAQGGTKIPREGLLSPAAVLPVKRPVCISYKLFVHLLFCTARYCGSASELYMGEGNDQPCSARTLWEWLDAECCCALADFNPFVFHQVFPSSALSSLLHACLSSFCCFH